MFARGLIITPLLVIFIESVCFSLQCMSAPISIIDKITIRQAVRLLAMIMIVTIQKKHISNRIISVSSRLPDDDGDTLEIVGRLGDDVPVIHEKILTTCTCTTYSARSTSVLGCYSNLKNKMFFNVVKI